MYIALLGRQPALSIAELERVYGDVRWFSDSAALVKTERLDIQRLGGTQKAGRVIVDIKTTDWNSVAGRIVKHYETAWKSRSGKITLGISAYGFTTSSREVQKIGLTLKSRLKNSGVNIRLIPNQEAELSSATSHHNKLGLADNKVELLIVKGRNGTILAESTGAQNITALAARDQGRPRRDAFVGMLPPKLAQIIINLAVGDSTDEKQRVLDPFCGTGVLLQEALLLRYDAYGTDLAEKMVRYSRDNLQWLQDKYRLTDAWEVHEGDATDTQWQGPITAVAAEAYLGQPFSAPPSPAKLEEVKGNCNFIISRFLKNIHPQLEPGTPLAIAVPAWQGKDGSFTHLPLIKQLDTLGYTPVAFQSIHADQLLYYRPEQVVAREILVITRQ